MQSHKSQSEYKVIKLTRDWPTLSLHLSPPRYHPPNLHYLVSPNDKRLAPLPTPTRRFKPHPPPPHIPQVTSPPKPPIKMPSLPSTIHKPPPPHRRTRHNQQPPQPPPPLPRPLALPDPIADLPNPRPLRAHLRRASSSPGIQVWLALVWAGALRAHGFACGMGAAVPFREPR